MKTWYIAIPTVWYCDYTAFRYGIIVFQVYCTLTVLYIIPTGIEDQDTFNLEMKGFLQELQCPYLILTKSVDSLSSHENRLLLLNYLLSELQTSRLVAEKEKQDVVMVILIEVCNICVYYYICMRADLLLQILLRNLFFTDNFYAFAIVFSHMLTN